MPTPPSPPPAASLGPQFHAWLARRLAQGALLVLVATLALFGAGSQARAAHPSPTPTPTATPTATPNLPPHASSPYRLPFPGGEQSVCVQGNNGSFSHRGMEAYAWDFAMPTGSVVLAARAGVVRFVAQESNVGGTNWSLYAAKGNYVVIDHGDGTSGVYLHLMYHGDLVAVGDHVAQGQPVAYSGATGFASGPHLHFMVEKTDPSSWFSQSIPTNFWDVPDHNGVPLEGETYTSGNASVTISRAPTITELANPAPSPAPPTGGAISSTVSATFTRDLTLPDGSTVFAGQTFTKAWSVRNSGGKAWPAGTHLAIQGSGKFQVVRVAAIDPVPPGTTVNVSVTLRAPLGVTDATEEEEWRLAGADETPFGDPLRLRVHVGGTLPTLPLAAPPSSAGSQYFAATGHSAAGRFLAFYRGNGGLDIFGYPRTEVLQEDGLSVQYYQRARFEYHPELPAEQQVQLTLLGDQLTTDQRPFPTADPFTSSADHRYFPKTRHSLNFGFLHYFDTHGGLTVFGYPVSEELPVLGPHGPTTVQYFQRARFEYHPEFAGTAYEVELGLLGDETLSAMGWLPLPPDSAAVPAAALHTASGAPAAPAASNLSTPAALPIPTATPAPSANSAVSLAAGQTAQVTAVGLRVHSDPTPDSAVVAYLARGDQVRVLSLSGDWAQVVTPNQTRGWVSATYLSAS